MRSCSLKGHNYGKLLGALSEVEHISELWKVVHKGRKKTWKWNQNGTLPTVFVFVVLFVECRIVWFSVHRIPFTRSVLPASFCNVNVVDFCSGSTWFESQLELLVSLWGSFPQSLCPCGPQIDGRHSQILTRLASSVGQWHRMNQFVIKQSATIPLLV
jgi:hypothetical protein